MFTSFKCVAKWQAQFSPDPVWRRCGMNSLILLVLKEAAKAAILTAVQVAVKRLFK
jgi:hypothetical protein